jgi:hypothetical protein
MMIVPGIAFLFTGPAFAQQTDAQTRNQVEAVIMKSIDSLNKGDGRSGAELQTADAVRITPFGKFTGAQILENTEKMHKLGLALTVRIDDVQLLPGGQLAIATGSYTGGFANDSRRVKDRGKLFMVAWTYRRRLEDSGQLSLKAGAIRADQVNGLPRAERQ